MEGGEGGRRSKRSRGWTGDVVETLSTSWLRLRRNEKGGQTRVKRKKRQRKERTNGHAVESRLALSVDFVLQGSRGSILLFGSYVLLILVRLPGERS